MRPDDRKAQQAAAREEENAGKKIEIETNGKDKSKEKAKAQPAKQAGQPGAESGGKDGRGADDAGQAAAGNDGDERTGDEQAAALKKAQEELAAEKDKYLRLAAEYDNFRKRSAKERDMVYGNAKADAIGKLLPVFDNLERALKLECSDEAYYKGVEMTMQQLTEILKSMGAEPIEAIGKPFDPNLHDAVARIEDKNLGEGIIAEEYQKGFRLGERIIRHSTVVVAN